MSTIARWSVIAGVVVSLAGLGTAQADDDFHNSSNWTLATVERPLTLGKGMLEIRGDTFRVGLSKDSSFEPLSIAPDIFYGISNVLTVGVYHTTGICLTGVDGGCLSTYNDLGIEGQFALMHGGSFQVQLHGGLLMPALSKPKFIMGMTAGVEARLKIGKIAVRLDPEFYVGFNERDSVSQVLLLPVWLQLQLNKQTMVFLSSGFNMDFQNDVNAIPMGLGANFAINHRIDLGLEFQFANAFGDDNAVFFGSTASLANPPIEPFDERTVIVRVALRI